MGGPIKIAVMWRSDWRNPSAPTRHERRLHPILDALRAARFEPVAIKFHEEEAEAARRALLACAGALVWINPIADGRERGAVDALLREASGRGIWVSAHPDVIARMGVKDVLHTTRDLGWGSDVARYASLAEFQRQFVMSDARGARVLKPLRGNDGRGVIKVSGEGNRLSVQFASDDSVESMTMPELCARVAPAFAGDGCVIDQEFHAAREGMVRCYMSFDRVIGFSRQLPRADKNGQLAFAMNPSKAMHASDAVEFADLRDAMDKDWTPGLKRILGLESSALPALWDADFLVRARGSPRKGRYALCEINASCVSPFPDVAPLEVAQGVRKWVRP